MKPLILALALALTALTSRAAEAPATNAPVSLQQKKSDLLAGLVKGICYSGFRHGQHPDRGEGGVYPTDAQILEDLRLLARDGNFKMLRLYDCGTNSVAVLRIIKSNKLPFKVMLGAWLNAEVSNAGCPWLTKPIEPSVLAANKMKNAAEVKEAIRLAAEYADIIAAVAVGNEALVAWNDHMVPVESVIAYVREVKKAVKQPVTVCDNYDWWARHGKELAAELDFVSVHTYPEWEQKDISQAMPYTIANLEAVRRTLPQSKLVITEAGWATVAREFGDRASEETQARYYRDLYEWAAKLNLTTFFFEAFDEDWKGETADPLGAEKHWGLFTVDRKAKLVMQPLYPDLAPAKAKASEGK